MAVNCQRCARLHAENERLQWRVDELEGLAAERAPLANLYGLSNSEQRILMGLIKRGSMTTEQLTRWLYPDPDKTPASNVISVLVWRMRKKMAEHGVRIEVIYGQGYKLTPDSIEQVRADMDRAKQRLAS